MTDPAKPFTLVAKRDQKINFSAVAFPSTN
jgi:hypothetical protein